MNLNDEICDSLAAWIMQNEKITETIRNAFPYHKMDISQESMPAIVLIPQSFDNRDPMYFKGVIQAKFIYPLKYIRDNKTVSALRDIGVFLQQLRNSYGIGVYEYVRQYVVGLVSIGLQTYGDYSGLYNSSDQSQSSCYINMEYSINWLLYNNWLEENRLTNISDPDGIIYHTVDKINIETEVI